MNQNHRKIMEIDGNVVYRRAGPSGIAPQCMQAINTGSRTDRAPFNMVQLMGGQEGSFSRCVIRYDDKYSTADAWDFVPESCRMSISDFPNQPPQLAYAGWFFFQSTRKFRRAIEPLGGSSTSASIAETSVTLLYVPIMAIAVCALVNQVD
jgi:hypothetical protein